ncbi:cyclase family protein [Salegentibacter mishustinae]|uniref:Metal-dependent hydrolase n=1 Tax=Salegentibacter mishustinae TaxID=270918 RepID=A0A0Q9Z8U9_9FLAO|nr:cyclase family protein [Salegentibacter mishustinae]KRG28457.1 metal-dependent hydrolase [Salegentibacter mishustinae]PNW22393.1 metal-dependent hydrolase [Salegentibacter mishustinae]PZX67624.1 kynurenine formamidase [Salegentibacter mishustinae]GGW78484.1 arylformamidase [Salegentibacter mishustinae]
MKTSIELNRKTYETDLSKPLDISIGLRGDEKNPVAWYLDAPKINPVKDGDFIGKVSEGASVNFNNIQFNPHAHGTHTECVGHISREFYSINQTLKTFFFFAKLISVEPETKGEDKVISEAILKEKIQPNATEALIIRTLPNFREKQTKKYSHTNWPYLSEEAAVYLRNSGIKHLLIDLPSVDKEKDGGKLLAHKAFWNYPKNTRFDATITELVYVPNSIEDGNYLLNLQIASFENDASPSKPVLYKFL